MKIIIFFVIFIYLKNLGVKGGWMPKGWYYYFLLDDSDYKNSVRPTKQTDCGCGYASQNYPSERIIGGKEVDSKHSLPFMVELLIEWKNSEKNVTCGGTLINRRLIITAAHCVKRMQDFRFRYFIVKGFMLPDVPAKIYAFMGTHNTKWNGPGLKLEKYEDLQVIVGSSETISIPFIYNDTSLIGDIALLKLPRNVEFNAYITPACLSSCKKDLIGKKAIIAGWGQSENPDDNFLKQATIDIVPYDDPACKDHGCIVPESGDDKKYCGHSLTSNFCVGDAGGPLIMKENGRYVIVGVASSNGGCHNFQKAGIYIDICPYINTILEYSRISNGWCKSLCENC